MQVLCTNILMTSADLNFLNTDISIFSETHFSQNDSNTIYETEQHNLFRNDGTSSNNSRPYGGTAVYNHIAYYPGCPFCCNRNGVEMTVIRLIMIPEITLIAI